MNTRHSPLLLLSFILFTAHAQTVNVDSLKKVVANPSDYKALIDASKSLSVQLNKVSFDDKISIAGKGLAAALQQKDTANAGILYHSLGTAFYFSGRFDSAAACYYKGVDFLTRTNQLSELASLYNDLGKLYRKIGPYSRSHEFYNRALAMYTKLKDKSGIATIYNEAGVLDEYEGHFEDAIKSYKASLTLCKELNDKVGIAYAYNFIAGASVQQGKFDEAEQYNTLALQIREELKDSFTIALTFTDFGSIYSAQKKYSQAEDSYLKSNAVAEKIGYPDLLRNNYSELSNIARAQNDYKKALEYFSKAASYKDSIYKTESSRQVEELSAKYETAEKEKQIQQQQFEIASRNYWIIAISALMILGALLTYSFYRRYQLKQQARLQREIQTQQEMATKAIIEAEEKERKRIAGDLHDGVGQMMSAAKMNLSAIENSISFSSEEQKTNFDKVVTLIDDSCKEVRNVSHNMMPNALIKSGLASAVREFTDKINKNSLVINLSTEGLDQRFDANTETVLYRIIQECVNNVIKHAQASELDISLIKDEEGISATIEDNGRGFVVAEASAFKGIGLQNIKSRVEFLKGSVEWNSAPGSGTLVAIHVPAA
ncbi:MAG TPA: sensor histidine kinase [Panacibacter sp.]|nr:sensor histidine kinase [Panacibacter sp.]HNP46805.1 sensor histidine kinase [Panacibacter sp.]